MKSRKECFKMAFYMAISAIMVCIIALLPKQGREAAFDAAISKWAEKADAQ